MRSILLRTLKQYGILLGFPAIFAAMFLLSPEFRDPWKLPSIALNIARQSSVYGIMAVGMTFVILTGGIDLSVGSMLALAGVICASLEHAGFPLPVVVAATLLLGCLMGLLNGAVVSVGKITPFVVTLGTMSIARGLAHLYTGGEPISRFGAAFRSLGAGEVPILLFGLSVIAAAVVLKATRLGRYTYAIGGNREAARLSGIPVGLYTAVAYVICGLTSAAGAVVLTARLNSAESIAGAGYELDVIASVVIGGTSLMGGRGSVWGTLLGALLIGTINSSMTMLNISSYYQAVVKGTVIVAAALLDRLREE